MQTELLIQHLLMVLLSFIISVTLHEFGHAYAADLLGDNTPRLAGRISLNPLDHLDPIGTILLVATYLMGFAFGWGRPVLVSPSNFKNPRLGDAIVSVAGPLMNLLLASVLAVIVRTGYFGWPDSSPWHQLIDVALDLNILLFLFNLIPISPLDGSHILADILPLEISQQYQMFMSRWNWAFLLLFFYFGGGFLGPMVDHLHNILAPGPTVNVVN